MKTQAHALQMNMHWGFLDCHWVGSLDFSFLGNQVAFSTNPPKSFTLFAGGSTATKISLPSEACSRVAAGVGLFSFQETGRVEKAVARQQPGDSILLIGPT